MTSSKSVRALLKIGLTLAVLVVVMLATIGAWEIYKGSVKLVGNAHADGAFDLLKCYSIKSDSNKPLNQKVLLLDELHPQGQGAWILFPHTLCTPAKKLVQ